MAVKKETSLQERIQKYIEKRGGYVNKNWGNMISRKGIADLTCCYKGYYIALEVKVDNNEPSLAQGIHCRKVRHSDGITAIVRTIEEVDFILNKIDYYNKDRITMRSLIYQEDYDDGTRY